MRYINKRTNIIRDNSGETIVEVLVAFTLLSIMLVIFSQGITWATQTEQTASNNRKAADEAMLQLQGKIAADRGTPITTGWGFADGRVYYKKYDCTVNGQNYTYIVYEATGLG